ncbi:MAG: hypothetical protein GWP10_20210 [Nitrospiraceae bacterium]|nr:hypothetical protein [Nitrospiraceae bacterium]
MEESIYIPSEEEFKEGIEEFKRHEKRDAMYKVATFLVSYFWNKSSNNKSSNMTDSSMPNVADGLGVLLLTWNQAFYRYGSFDFDKLENCINNNKSRIEKFRRRNISSFSEKDIRDIKDTFNDFLEALQTDSGNMKVKRSPVAVAKALHLLAPKFFPLWDKEIAKKYRCNYNNNPAEKYIKFMKLMKRFAEEIRKDKGYTNSPDCQGRTLLKLIDEYNYSKYTKGWIRNKSKDESKDGFTITVEV